MRIALVGVFTILSTLYGVSQDSLTKFDKLVSFPTKFFKNVNHSANKFEQKLYTNTDAVLDRLYKQEKKLKRKLAKSDSVLAKKVFSETDSIYSKLKSSLVHRELSLNPRNDQYIPFLDTLRTSFRFLDENATEFPNVNPQELSNAISQIRALQGKLNQCEQIQRFIKERKDYLKRELGQLYLIKEFKHIEKEVYYYQQKVLEYKNILNDSRKLEATAIRLLQKIPSVSKFLGTHSELASLFRLPDNGMSSSNPLNIQGLQTRNAVLQQVQQGLGAGADPNQLIQQQAFNPQSQLNQLKDKINQLGGGSSSDSEMPSFNPNSQRSKSILDRLEFGFNIQSVKGTYYFPVTTDLGLSIGYKINDKSVAGIGMSHKMGWGSGWNHIRFTHQGVGLRSFIDWKVKGSFWVSGGAEMNYRNEIKNISILKNFSAWQSSALIGISKKFKINKKVKGSLQLLYDFMHARQVPPTSPLLFRVGYTLSK